MTKSINEKLIYPTHQEKDGTISLRLNYPITINPKSLETIKIPTERYNDRTYSFRGVWVATIYNLHFEMCDSMDSLKTNFLEHLSVMKSMELNALIFQVRPSCDAAFYISDINPTSAYFTGIQGKPSEFDPMPWLIETAHKNGIEFHAWFNPLRVDNKGIDKLVEIYGIEYISAMSVPEKIQLLQSHGTLASSNFACKHPECVLEYDRKLFLNPSKDLVRQHVEDTVIEFVVKYKPDAIHFDDYFYPYKTSDTYFGDANEDYEDYLNSNEKFDTIESWRRSNITKMIQSVKNVVDEYNRNNESNIKFGISPYAIWEHKENNSLGSNTFVDAGQSFSKTIFADTYEWIRNNRIDYVIPQLYNKFGDPMIPYGELVSWWNNTCSETQVKLYTGHGNFRIESDSNTDPDWLNFEEIPNQLLYNQKFDYIEGCAFFSFNQFIYTDSNKHVHSILRKTNKLIKEIIHK